MVKAVSLLTGFASFVLVCMPIMYAMRTLIGMKRKDVYPLLRIRRADGTCVPVIRINASREFLGTVQTVNNEGRWHRG